MPRGDRTGPAGLGPMTGRGLGYCAGYSAPGFTTGPGMGLGRGWGRGFGRGIGWGRGYWGSRGLGWGVPSYAPYTIPAPGYAPTAPISSVDQLAMLKQEKEYLASEMNGIKSAIENIAKRIEDLEKSE